MKISAPGILYVQVRFDIDVCWDGNLFFKNFTAKDSNAHHFIPYLYAHLTLCDYCLLHFKKIIMQMKNHDNIAKALHQENGIDN